MTNSKYTHIAVVADRSGSMFSIADDMNGGLKTFLEEQDALPGELKIDVTVFDTSIDTPHSGITASGVQWPLIVPRGGTALYDALGQTVVSLGEKFDALEDEERPGKVIVVVVTDGQENSSVEYVGASGAAQIKEMVERQQSEYQWEFIFLGANIDSFDVAGSFGIPKGSTMNYTTTSAGVSSMMRSASTYVSQTRGGHTAEFTDEDREQATQS